MKILDCIREREEEEEEEEEEENIKMDEGNYLVVAHQNSLELISFVAEKIVKSLSPGFVGFVRGPL